MGGFETGHAALGHSHPVTGLKLSLLRKRGVRDRVVLARYAIRARIIEP